MPITIIKKSNKTQTPGKTTEEVTHGKQKGAISVGKPMIDQLSLVLHPQTPEEASDIHSNIWSQFEDKSVFQSAGPLAQKGWRRAVRVALPSTDIRPLLQYRWDDKTDTHEGLATAMRLDFNPRKLGSHGLSDLKSVMMSLLPNGWEYVISHGRMSRIDIMVDISNIRMDEFHLVPKQAASTMGWGRNGHLQTLRLGEPQGNQTLVYSVKQKRLGKKQAWAGPSVIRVERRLRNPSPSKLGDLSLMKNPFSDMAFTFLPDPPPGEKEWVWSMFKDSARLKGLVPALAQLTEDRRTHYRKHLKAVPQVWWQPKVIWEGWPSAYKDLLSP